MYDYTLPLKDGLFFPLMFSRPFITTQNVTFFLLTAQIENIILEQFFYLKTIDNVILWP